jgi:hypothetical protein
VAQGEGSEFKPQDHKKKKKKEKKFLALKKMGPSDFPWFNVEEGIQRLKLLCYTERVQKIDLLSVL